MLLFSSVPRLTGKSSQDEQPEASGGDFPGLLSSAMPARRFPPPWSVEELDPLVVSALKSPRENGPVILLGQASGISPKGKMQMTLILVMVFNILVALAMGFVVGRLYQIRRDEFGTTRHRGYSAPLSSATKLLTKDEARRIAANIAKLPELVRR